MRLYTPFEGPSTPFVVFFYKKAMFFPTFQINLFKTRGWRSKNIFNFLKNMRVFMDMTVNLGKALNFFALFIVFLPAFLILGKTLKFDLVSDSMLLCTIN
jgi:hypothetical protein